MVTFGEIAIAIRQKIGQKTSVTMPTKTADGRWKIDIYRQGNRVRKTFLSRALAEAFEQQAEHENYRRKLGIKELDHNQYAVAVECFRMLPEEADLLSIVRQWVAQHKHKEMPLELGIEAFLDDLKKRNRRPAYVDSIRKRLEKFQRFFGPEAGVRSISSYSRDDIAEFLEQGIKDTPINRINNLRDLRTFWEWAKEENLVAENIPATFRNPTVDRKNPAVLTPTQAEDMLNNSKSQDRAYAALGMFAGIRPEELVRLDWKYVDLEHAKVTVPADVSKTRMQRTVELEPNAVAWLRTVQQPSGPVFKGGRKWLTVRLLEASKMEYWTQDILRHSFVTYHTIAFENPGRTALMIHAKEKPDVLLRRYFQDSLKSDALKFWQIWPEPTSPCV
jgi:integrase